MLDRSVLVISISPQFPLYIVIWEIKQFIIITKSYHCTHRVIDRTFPRVVCILKCKLTIMVTVWSEIFDSLLVDTIQIVTICLFCAFFWMWTIQIRLSFRINALCWIFSNYSIFLLLTMFNFFSVLSLLISLFRNHRCYPLRYLETRQI